MPPPPLKVCGCRCKAHPECLTSIRGRSRAFFSDAGFPPESAELMVLGVDEACANVIRHACANDARRVFRVRWEKSRSSVNVRIRDYARPLDPARIPARELGDIRPGGLGLPLIRAAFDTVRFVPRPRGTELILTRRIPGQFE